MTQADFASREAAFERSHATASGGEHGAVHRPPSIRKVLLVLADIILLNISFVIGYIMRYQLQWFREVGYDAKFSDYFPIQIMFTLSFLGMFVLDGVYSSRRFASWLDQAVPVLNASAKAMIIILAIVFVYRPLTYSRLMMMEAGLVGMVLILILRAFTTVVVNIRRRQGLSTRKVLIVGAGEAARAAMRVLVARPELGRRCVGFVDDDPLRGSTNIGRFPALGALDCLPQMLQSGDVDELVITLPWSEQEKIAELINLCREYSVQPRIAPNMLQLNLGRIDVDDFGGIPMLSTRQEDINPADKAVKRVMDIVFGVLALVIASPIILLCCLLISLESPGAPIFSQYRIGKNGKPFIMYKLRSMRKGADAEKAALMEQNEADGPLFKMRNDPRITRIGKFIRRTSIDELLQFWNVLKGEMSIVGPRPHLPQEVSEYLEWHHTRLSVRPGVTGLSQISGRSELTFDETVLLDVYYIENWSPSMDIKIMLRTLPYLLTAKGAY